MSGENSNNKIIRCQKCRRVFSYTKKKYENKGTQTQLEDVE